MRSQRRPPVPVPPPAPLPEPETLDLEALRASCLSGETDLICVLGPTASGKTRYAVALADALHSPGMTVSSFHGLSSACGSIPSFHGSSVESLRCEIISADSRQVYRGMTIGTGKDLAEYGDIPYHLIDIADAGERYDLYRYQQDFERVYADIRARGAFPILCGGTGLYIQAVTHAFALQNVPADWNLRRELEEMDPERLLEQYRRCCGEPDETTLASRRRLIRGLEVAYAREKGLPDGGEVRATNFYPKNTFFIGTLVDREERNRRIDARLDARLQEGLVEEVKGLLEQGLGPEDLIYYGLEYKFVTQYLLGLLDYDSMRLQLATAIHQFAKRQMTFFRGMEAKGDRIHWVKA